MQKFFDMLTQRFADAIERGFTLAADRMRPALDKPTSLPQEPEKVPKVKELTNGRKN